MMATLLEIKGFIKRFYAGKYSPPAIVLFPALYGIERASGALQHDRYDNRRQIRRHLRALGSFAEQPDNQLCRYALPCLFQCGTGAYSAGSRG